MMLQVRIPTITYDNAVVHFHEPLSEWFTDLFEDEDIPLDAITEKQNVQGFLNSYQYLLLMSFVSSFMPIEERPLYNYLNGLEQNGKVYERASRCGKN